MTPSDLFASAIWFFTFYLFVRDYWHTRQTKAIRESLNEIHALVLETYKEQQPAPMPDETMPKIIAFLGMGNLKQALYLLVEETLEAVSLQSQFNQGEKRYNLGLSNFDEWEALKRRIKNDALELVEKISKKKSGE